MTESAGRVNVTVNVLNGTLARDVHVLLMTSLNDSTATGIQLLKTIFHKSFFYLIFMSFFSHI